MFVLLRLQVLFIGDGGQRKRKKKERNAGALLHEGDQAPPRAVANAPESRHIPAEPDDAGNFAIGPTVFSTTRGNTPKVSHRWAFVLF